MKQVTEDEARALLADPVQSCVYAMERAAFERSDPEYGGTGEVDWAGEAYVGIGEYFLGGLEGDQDLAWRAIRAVDGDVTRIGEFWTGTWARMTREAFDALILAAIEEGILEDRRDDFRN